MSEGPRHYKAGIPAFYYLSGWVVGGWWVGVLDKTKAIISPAGSWLWAELEVIEVDKLAQAQLETQEANIPTFIFY